MPTTRDGAHQPTRVHVAGPVETESVAGRRIRRQRCLRCDLILWTGGRSLDGIEHPIGNAIAWVEIEGSMILRDLGRADRRAGELPCEPLPSDAL